MQCDIYLFCLWHRSKNFWKYIVKELSKEYQISIYFKSIFPDSLDLVKKFYNNEYLTCGYQTKLEDIKGEFVFFTCKDKEYNNYTKLYSYKKRFRNLSDKYNDFGFLHSSISVPEFIRQLTIIGELPWK